MSAPQKKDPPFQGSAPSEENHTKKVDSLFSAGGQPTELTVEPKAYKKLKDYDSEENLRAKLEKLVNNIAIYRVATALNNHDAGKLDYYTTRLTEVAKEYAQQEVRRFAERVKANANLLEKQGWTSRAAWREAVERLENHRED